MEIDQQRTLEVLGNCIRYGNKLCNYNADFTIIEADEGYAELVGLTPEEKDTLVGMAVKDSIHPGDMIRVAKEVFDYVKEHREYECKYRLKIRNGDYVWVKDSGQVVTYEGRDCVRSIVVDINEQETMVKQRDVNYELVPGGVVFLVVSKDNFFIREANKHYFDLMGTSREDYLGSSGKYTFPEDLPGLREHLVTQAAAREPVDYEFRVRKEDGNVRWYRILANHYDTREEGEEYLAVLIDILDRKTAQFELIGEKEKYRMAMRNTADLMYEYDVQDEELRLFGRNYVTEDTVLCLDDVTKMNYKKLIFESGLIYQSDRKKLMSFIKNEEYRYDNMRMLTQNIESGKKYYDNYEFYINKVYNDHKKLTRVVGYAKKISYMAIPATVKQELHQIFDEQIVKDYSFILKIDVKTESFVPYFIEELSWEEYRGNRYYDSFLYWWCKNMVIPREQKEISFFLSLEQMLRILHSGEPRGYRFCRVKGRDQKYRHMICSFSFYGSDVNTIIFMVRDVNVIRSEEQYQEKENQKILTDILGEAKQAVEERKVLMEYIFREISVPVMMMKELMREGQDAENLKELGRCVEYLGEMIENVKEYIQLEMLQNRSGNMVSLYNICTEVCKEERKISLGLDISINEYIALPESKLYFVHEFRFKEILINLLGNAIRYAPKGAEIDLYIQEKPIGDNKCNINIIMEDDGLLIDEHLYERTGTDEDEIWIRDKIVALGGTSCSISLAGRIAGLMGGTITFKRGVMHNNIIQLDIPVYTSGTKEDGADKFREGGEEDVHETDLVGQGILLVEREGGFNKLTAPLLRVNGAVVYTASRGAEAIELLDKFHAGIISVILVDRELEDMDCYEFAKKIKLNASQSKRRLPLIAMLEGIRSEDTKLGLMSGINASINKPINVKKLVSIIENLQGKMNFE